MTHLVISCQGGVTQAIHCDDPNIIVVHIDWDEEEEGGQPGHLWHRVHPLEDLGVEARAEYDRVLEEAKAATALAGTITQAEYDQVMAIRRAQGRPIPPEPTT